MTGGIHKAITDEALKDFGFSKQATKKVNDANYAQDRGQIKAEVGRGGVKLVPNKNYNPAHHFDRNKGESHGDAAERGAKYVQDQKKKIKDLINECKFAEALDALGQALHALQDFYSHSNYVDLTADEQAQADKALTDPDTSMPDSIKITGYDKETGKDPAGDDYGHDAHSKDNPTKNDDAKKKDADGKTNHEKARDAATKASKAFIQCIKDMVPEEKWNMFRNWTPG